MVSREKAYGPSAQVSIPRGVLGNLTKFLRFAKNFLGDPPLPSVANETEKLMNYFATKALAYCALIMTEGACGTAGLAAGVPSGRNDDSASAADAKKIDAPVPGLTERERWLLERVEQLEKRVAELEAKGQARSAPATEAAAMRAPIGSVSAIVGTVAANGTTAGLASVAAPAPTAGIQEKASKTPTKAEPFAFADFTWLNGNA